MTWLACIILLKMCMNVFLPFYLVENPNQSCSISLGKFPFYWHICMSYAITKTSD